MKKAILILGWMVGVAIILNAQSGEPNRNRVRNGKMGEFNQELKQELQLSKEQSESWDKLVQVNREKIKSIRSNVELSEEEKRDAARSNFKVLHEDLRSLLDVDQQEKFDAYIAKNRAQQHQGQRVQMQHREGSKGSLQNQEKRMEMLKSKLELSDQQVEKITSIDESYRKRMQEMKQESEERQDKDREAFRKLMEERDAEVLAVLSSEQQAAYLQMRDEMKKRRQ